MIRNFFYICCLLFTAVPLSTVHAEFRLIDPVIYPCTVTGNSRPWILWQDIYNTRKKMDPALYRIRVTAKDEDAKKTRTYITRPAIYHRFFYGYRLPASLEDNSYQLTVERIIGGASVDSRYYHYRRYPVKQDFIIDVSADNKLDYLEPGSIIQYIYMKRNNILGNGYNSLFFLSSGLASFGIGMLFYAVIDWGVVSTIIYVIAFTSSATGLTAGTVYGIRYLREKRKMNRILHISTGTSLQGSIGRDRMDAAVEKRF